MVGRLDIKSKLERQDLARKTGKGIMSGLRLDCDRDGFSRLCVFELEAKNKLEQLS